MKIYKTKDWSFRNNIKRKEYGKKNGKHPSIVIGEKDNMFANLGLTHSDRRGHHKNILLSRNPNKKDKKPSYVRDDLRFDDMKYLHEVLNYRKLPKKDIDKIMKIINKKR